MEIVYDEPSLERYMAEAVEASPEHPILIDKFLEDANEVDVDAVCDGERTIVGGVMEHIEEAGIHSGDSACAIPPFSLAPELIARLKEQTYALAEALKVRGLMNIQFAVKNGDIYVLEVNPRASRTVPFVSKATGLNLAQAAARVMVGKTLEAQGITAEPVPKAVSVKEAVFPFAKFPGVDIVLGPEMRSTGEVMGVGTTFGEAFAKAQIAAGLFLPTGGTVFFSVNDHDKRDVGALARRFVDMGFRLVATYGTAAVIEGSGLQVDRVYAVKEGRPNVVDLIKGEGIQLIVNTPQGQDRVFDEQAIRRAAVAARVPTITTMAAAKAAADGIEALQRGEYHVSSLQELHAAREAVTA
jgi:carbamoyl-phosphate synthase large subunit